MSSLPVLYGKGRRKKRIEVEQRCGGNPSQQVIRRHTPCGVELRSVPELLRECLRVRQVDRAAWRAGNGNERKDAMREGNVHQGRA